MSRRAIRPGPAQPPLAVGPVDVVAHEGEEPVRVLPVVGRVRPPRVRRTRRALGAALLDLVEESGYEGVTVAHVVARADVSRATFYLHYPDREALLLDTVDLLLGDLEQTIEPLTAEGVAGGEDRSVHLFRAVASRHTLWRALLTERGPAVVQSRLRARLAAFMQRNTTAHLVAAARHPLDAGLLAAHAAGSLMGLLVWWLEHDLPEPPEGMGELFRQLNTLGTAGTLGLAAPVPAPPAGRPAP